MKADQGAEPSAGRTAWPGNWTSSPVMPVWPPRSQPPEPSPGPVSRSCLTLRQRPTPGGCRTANSAHGPTTWLNNHPNVQLGSDVPTIGADRRATPARAEARKTFLSASAPNDQGADECAVAVSRGPVLDLEARAFADTDIAPHIRDRILEYIWVQYDQRRAMAWCRAGWRKPAYWPPADGRPDLSE